MSNGYLYLITTILIGIVMLLLGYSEGINQCDSYDMCNCSDNIRIISIDGKYIPHNHKSWNIEVRQELSLEDVNRLKKTFKPYSSLKITVMEGDD